MLDEERDINETKTQSDSGNGKKNGGIGVVLFAIYTCFLIAAVVILGRIIYLQWFYRPDEAFIASFTPHSSKKVIEPERGTIMATDGKPLAVTIPKYQITMDCTVRKQEFLNMEEREKGEEAEAEWMADAKELSKGLARIYKDKTADQYYDIIATKRRNNDRHFKIGGLIDYDTYKEVIGLPLFRKGRYKGGIIVEKFDKRIYPYGSLAKRTLGNLDDNNPNNDDVGIEGKFDYALHGKEGFEWLREADNGEWIKDYDSTEVKVEDGMDIRSTLNIEIQAIAEKAVRSRIEGKENLEGACAIVMDVKTGAIRAMVNLTLDENGIAREKLNYAVGRAGEPGSVFKTVTLMTLLEDRKAKLSTKVPTFNGEWSYNGEKLPSDPYLKKWPSSTISLQEGLNISSNQVFRYLVCERYSDNPKRFIDKYYEYKLGEVFDFDVKGLGVPSIPRPGTPQWSGTTLPTVSYGYGIKETPLHITMFYNGIANRGKLMKPYLVESIEKDGKVIEKFKPTVLNGSICSETTIDSLFVALRSVVVNGTGSKLKSAKCEVAGKTGTARMLMTFKRNGKDVTSYLDDNGNRQHQGSFVGFFPVEDPQYTVMVVVYAKPSRQNFYGGDIPALAVKEIVDNIYSLSYDMGDEIVESGRMPDMRVPNIETGADNLNKVPNIKGLGLKDAIYSVENCGYKFTYEGVGRVTGQTPAAGTTAKKGSMIHFVLR